MGEGMRREFLRAAYGAEPVREATLEEQIKRQYSRGEDRITKHVRFEVKYKDARRIWIYEIGFHRARLTEVDKETGKVFRCGEYKSNCVIQSHPKFVRRGFKKRLRSLLYQCNSD